MGSSFPYLKMQTRYLLVSLLSGAGNFNACLITLTFSCLFMLQEQFFKEQSKKKLSRSLCFARVYQNWDNAAVKSVWGKSNIVVLWNLSKKRAISRIMLIKDMLIKDPNNCWMQLFFYTDSTLKKWQSMRSSSWRKTWHCFRHRKF